MKSKRLVLSFICILGNFWIFYTGIHQGTDFISLGTGLAIVNTPLIAYIVGESYRPSGTMPIEMKQKDAPVSKDTTKTTVTTSETSQNV